MIKTPSFKPGVWSTKMNHYEQISTPNHNIPLWLKNFSTWAAFATSQHDPLNTNYPPTGLSNFVGKPSNSGPVEKKPKTIKRQPNIPTDEEHQKLEEAILSGKKPWHVRHRDWIIFKVASMTGMRLKEVLTLNLKNIDFSARKILIPAEVSKDRRETFVWISDKLMKLLDVYINQQKEWFDEGFLFTSHGHNKESFLCNDKPCLYTKTLNKYLSVPYWQWIWKQYIKKAGLYEIKFFNSRGMPQQKFRFHHCTRTYFINKLFDANKDRNIVELGRITRHKSVQCLCDYYLKFNDEKLWKDCVSKI